MRAADAVDDAALADLAAKMAPLVDDVYPLTSPLDPRFPVHTTLGTVEVFPDTMTPNAWSSTGEGLSRMARRIGVEMGILPRSLEIPFQGIFYGHCATNISAYYYFNRRLPGAPWWPWSAAAAKLVQPHADPIMGWEPPTGIAAWVGDVFWRMRGRRRTRALEARLCASLEPLESELERAEAETIARDFRGLSVAELIAEIRKPSLNAKLVELHMATTFFVGSHYMKLVTELARHTELPPVRTANALLQHLGDVESAKPAKALKALALRAREVPRLAELLRTRKFADFAETMSNPADDRERGIAEQRAAFLRQYGYRGIGEAAFDATTWAEDPSQADALLALYIDDDRVARTSRESDTREALAARIVDGIGTASLRTKMAAWIANAQRFAAMRERTKSLSVRQSLRQRRILKALTERMVADGVLAAEADRDMLSFKEFLRAPAMDRAALAALIAKRRAAYELLRNVELAEETFRGLPAVRVAGRSVAQDAPTTSRFAGLGISPGVVEGIACVVRDPRLGVSLRPGDILVAPYTDAAWSPLFLLASGIVIDSATMISHGATVARELGIAAVANVPGTRAIRSGDRIRIDADHGVVEILERAAAGHERSDAPARTSDTAATAGAPRAMLDFTAERLAVLRALRLKGRASLEALAGVTRLPGATVQSVLTSAADASLAESKGATWRLTPAGADLQLVWLRERRPPRDVADALYESFLPLNSRFKELVFRWQMKDASTPNDHADSQYDAAVLAQLAALDTDVRPFVAQVVELAPRLAPYAARLHDAMRSIDGGDRKFFTSPAVDSYHSIWFEFHEDLIELCGRTRAEEAAAGRAA